MASSFKPLAVICGLIAGVTLLTSTAQAQFLPRVPGQGFYPGPVIQQRPGFYFGAPGGTNFNPFTGSVYRPWAGTVTKRSGNYFYVPGTGAYTPFGRIPGTGVYQNPWTGNQYQPGTGLYTRPWGW